MKITTIETRTFESLLERLERLSEAVRKLSTGATKTGKWLDNQDVCQLLNISKRTLQTYRNNGTLPYSQIERKVYYRADDVERVLKSNLKNE